MKFREGLWDDIQGYTKEPHPDEKREEYCHPPDYCPEPCHLAEKGLCTPESQESDNLRIDTPKQTMRDDKR